jgi:hypothetical protein
MMELLSKKYTLNEINDISFIGFECVLNDETLSLIEEINNKVGSPNYIKTPIFNKRIKKSINDGIGFLKKNDGMNQKKKIKEIINDDDWDLLSSFEVTKIEKKEGIDTEIVDIRSLLNMLTESNFSNKYDSIIIILDKLNIFSLEEKNKMYNVIIDITSGNSFYSEIYAKLFSKIVEKYKIINELFFERIKLYLNNFEFVENVNNESYDELCKKNKENDKSEAFSLFLVNLEKYNVIEKEVIINIIDNLLKKLLFYLKNSLYKSMVDKIIENLFILYKKEWLENIFIKINDKDKAKTKIIDLINGIVENIKVNIYPGISNKSKSYFKLIDTLEK